MRAASYPNSKTDDRREDDPMRHTMQKTGRLLAALALSGVLLASGLMAQAAPAPQPGSKGLELEVTEMDLEITEEDPRPRAYLYTGSGSDYYFIVWMSSNPTVATVDGDGKVTGRSAGTATITAISDRGDRAACKVTVTKEGAGGEAKKPALDQSSLSFALKYDDLHPTKQLKLINNDHSFIYVYQWLSSNPEVATVDENGLVTAQGTGGATITALASNGQAVRCTVTVTSDIGRVTLNKNDLLFKTVRKDSFYYYKKLIAFRKADEHQDPLIYGKTVPFHPELSKLFGYQRIGEKETLTALCSFSAEEIRVPLDTLIPKVVLNNKETFTMNGTDLVLAPYQAVVLASAAE